MCEAQSYDHYQGRKLHSAASQKLSDSLNLFMRLEMSSMANAPHLEVVKRINTERTKILLEMVRREAFIKDDTLERFVNGILARIVDSNQVRDFPRKVLIQDSPTVNAFCFGQGIYIVTIGLLGRIYNEHELAFTLAHEVAHDDLDHVKSKIVQEAEINLAKKSREQVRKILSGTIVLQDIEEFRKLIYGVQRHSRQKELQADSMGLVLLHGARYHEGAASVLLDILDQSMKPKYDAGVEIFLPLHSDLYPLQEYWFSKRLSVYSRKPGDNFMFAIDSVESHPDIPLRKKELERYYSHETMSDGRDDDAVSKVILMAEFETVESAYRNKDYDRCVFQALQLWKRFPANAYLTTRIGKVLTELYEAKNNNNLGFSRYVSHYISYYSEELLLVNNFLHNLTAKEMGELAYYFLSNPRHFNTGTRAHYYLMWKICGATFRNEERDKISREYRKLFGQNISGFDFK